LRGWGSDATLVVRKSGDRCDAYGNLADLHCDLPHLASPADHFARQARAQWTGSAAETTIDGWETAREPSLFESKIRILFNVTRCCVSSYFMVIRRKRCKIEMVTTKY